MTTVALRPITDEYACPTDPRGPVFAVAIRVVPPPRSEPPTDAERDPLTAEPSGAAPTLPLDMPGEGDEPRRGRRHGGTAGRPNQRALSHGGPAHLPQMGQVAVADVPPIDADGRPFAFRSSGPSAPNGAPDVRLATRRFLATCVEVMGGYRPTNQLRPLCVPDNFTRITERLAGPPAPGPAERSRGVAHLPGRPPAAGQTAVLGRSIVAARTPVAGRFTGAPPRGGRSGQSSPGDRVLVRRVQICEIGDEVAEVAVVLARHERVWAMALRFECHDRRWLCSWLEVL